MEKITIFNSLSNMKKQLLPFVILFTTQILFAQTPTQFPTPVSYLDYLNAQHKQVLENFMSYSSTVAHSKKAKKIEARRKELITAALNAKKQVKATNPTYEGGKALRDSAAAFFEINYNLLNDDYAKIVDLEEVAEQSYDAMEAYFRIQDIVDEKIKKANQSMTNQYQAYADKNNIRLVEGKEDELSKKVTAVNKVNHYHRQLFLIKFKCSNQEQYIVQAMNKKDLNAIEQSKNVLLKYTEESLQKLDTVKAYENDRSLIDACRKSILFYQSEAKEYMPVMLDFYVKEDNFAKIKKAFEAKKPNERTQESVNEYNTLVKEVNTAVEKYNKTNKMLNEKRVEIDENWNKATNRFVDVHTPKY
jgi:hypothetical protein